jgi:hypothetical protein
LAGFLFCLKKRFYIRRLRHNPPRRRAGGFSAIGIEREPEYCDMIRKRMAELQPALPLAK